MDESVSLFSDLRLQLIIAAVGCACAALGSLLSWASISDGLISVSVGGMVGDGKITIACSLAALLVVLGLTRRFMTSYVSLAAALSVIACGIGIYHAVQIDHLAAGETNALVSIGDGLWLVMIGGGIAALALIILLFRYTETENARYTEAEDV